MYDLHDLTRALGSALEHQPQEQRGILRGFALALQTDAVRLDATLPEDAQASVASQSGPGRYETTRQSCGCRHSASGAPLRCAHQWALLLTLAARRFALDRTPKSSLRPIAPAPMVRRTGYGPWPADETAQLTPTLAARRFALDRTPKSSLRPIAPAPDETAQLTPTLAAEICDPDRRVARELSGFSGPTARHS